MLIFLNVLILFVALAGAVTTNSEARKNGLAFRVAKTAAACEPDFITVRRWFHHHPELSNREFETAAEITRRLVKLGYKPGQELPGPASWPC